MVKKIWLLVFSAFILHADPIDEVIFNIMGEQSYKINQNFIQRLFTDKNKFFLDNNQQKIDYYTITKTLKDNGLLYLGFKKPMEVSLGFKAKTKPAFLIKAINSILSSMGYSYFSISKAKYAQDTIMLIFSLNTEHGVAPEIILSEFQKRGILASKVVRKNKTDWEYELEVINPSIINATLLEHDSHLEFKNISGEYWFAFKDAGKISIVKKNPKIGWSPKIVLYDKNLQILEILTQKEFTASAEVNITNQTAFVMVTDLNNPSRLKSGIIVTFFEFGKDRQ